MQRTADRRVPADVWLGTSSNQGRPLGDKFALAHRRIRPNLGAPEHFGNETESPLANQTRIRHPMTWPGLYLSPRVSGLVLTSPEVRGRKPGIYEIKLKALNQYEQS